MEIKQEAHLIERAQKGDVAAFEKLILSYEKHIYNLCLRILKDEEEAYDAAQEVLVKVWRQLGTFKAEAKFGTWLYRLTTNQCLDLIRKNKKRACETSLFMPDEKNQEEKMASHQSVWEDMSSVMMKKEQDRVLLQGIDELKEDYRVIILLRDIEGKSYEEISQILDLSLGTVKSRIARARLALKKILEQDKEPYRSFFRHKNK